MNVFQHLDELKDSDGVGNDAIGLAEVFQNLGYNTHFITRLPRKGKPLNSDFHLVQSFDFPTHSNDIHILHYGGSGYPYTLFQELPGIKILRFHNVTPAKFYEHTTTEDIYHAMEKFESLSYLEIASLSIFCDSVWCDSQFNYDTLSRYQFRNPYILPICKQYEKIPKKQELVKNKFSISFVGRFSPQKKWEDLITFFSNWAKEFPDAECFCVGSIIGAFDGYFDRLTENVRKYHLENKVHFLMGKPDSEVLSILNQSSAFVSMSEHEGFCLPILEAFGAGIPVFAYAQGAIPGTMREGGKLFFSKENQSLIQIMKETLLDKEKYRTMIQTQFNVLGYYNQFPFAEAISGILRSGIK
ncbi:Glycosyltransferase [Leptospira biflexa serovar Patoc strain 'Patoc 1 (Ames)']|uniref:Putative glycosyltransferase n=1 Tax=Leptospira biflexa serovar Patoc (strain Patoc 1 / ATCC 23582 / Paris) TaxID=456481 RepID=B0SQT1_LEPBP|nr:glycosyltransferase [Leptospira biflexa]ABZ95619.1 Glycosyltransferase [Leptospira biflexa serovar Patoc strain 'Patoc 1 (Ames)']ABZ99328.1 Putative glycosyltransferase [Leptospira biflexa serovar Patoc strain 'Patoc 1 (Paris)']